MTPFGKPAADIELCDLRKLIEQQEPEGRHLEYKEGIPTDDRARDRQKRGGDAAQPQGQSLSDYGRDKLLRELVAFANADGGLLVLGITETTEKPPRAAAFNPLPDIAAIEGKLRNVIIDCIEPRLPYAAVKAIPTDADGAGIVVVEIEPSRLGPHWVRTTREATIRREDTCSPLTMPEIHSMVIRNARRFDDIEAVLRERSVLWVSQFHKTLTKVHAEDGTQAFGHGELGTISPVHFETMAYAVRVTVVPHEDFGIARLEDHRTLIPSLACGVEYDNDGNTRVIPFSNFLWLQPGRSQKILGGVTVRQTKETIESSYTITREGLVESSLVRWNFDGRGHLLADMFVAFLACSLGVFCLLRKRAGSPALPAEVSIELVASSSVGVSYGEPGAVEVGRPLGPRLLMPRRTVGEPSDFSELMNDSAGDLMNASDLEAALLPRYGFVDPDPMYSWGGE